MDWNDLRTLLAVADGGGIQGGADALGIHSTTVSRRIRDIEAEQRVRIFERYRHGVVLTDAGQEAIEVAREVRSLVDGLAARLHGRDTQLSGTVRLTSIDSILARWMPHFAEFQQRYPDIQLELSSGMNLANLTKREADVAVRIAGQAPEHLIGSKVCGVAHGVYASKAMLEAYGPDSGRGDFPWIAYDLSVFRGIDGFLEARHPEARIVMRVPRIDLLLGAIEDGVGIGILNCHAGDSNPKLRRLGPADAGMSQLWILTHPELRGTTRISTFMQFVRGVVADERDLWEGRRPAHALA
ncbi:MAG: LysR family transcriptional regulator [Proteobacteria bacterium]|nr:LysR family transcriptional regulator [Pseudomonadota bacterium]